jgi:uncharacterized membrane protein YkgB
MRISEAMDRRLTRLGTGVFRWSLVLFFVGFGLFKFTPQEAAGVAPLMPHSPFLFVVNPLFGQRGRSDFIGIIEITFGVLITLRHFQPLLSGYSSLGTAVALLITRSFLFTTPGLDFLSADAGFLLEDLNLFGVALFVGAEAFGGARRNATGG